ncbi:BLUF domain-containing protein [Sphingopyxis sp. PET50]|uniref:BLUF domain-containing protein n=1 Tax=Sphingopyxis sp. PET50 TaxID=2976533 RepID=UPI0021AEC26E|nr:BLUF domain-containing protein [Sphingopyxis sp. PET50]
MLSVIYVSVADPDLGPADIASMVAGAQANNARDGLTGALIYNGQNFMQLLEGPVAGVEACLARIRADLRHHGMIEVRRRLVDVREFADFSMLYSPLFRAHDEDLSRLAARRALDPQDERLMSNFLGLGRPGGAG